MTAYDVLSKLKGVKRANNGWTARCPAHDDERNSLSIREGDERRVLLYCFAGCGYEQIVASLGVERQNGSKRLIVAEYNYTGEAGDLLFQAIRYEPKGFSQRRPDGRGGWIHNLDGVCRVLYRLPELLAADPQTFVFLPEGEKDVDLLINAGLTATTNPCGAGKWREEYNEHLRGRHIVILPDNDEPGRKHAAEVARSLQRVAASVRVVHLSGLPEKGDVSDWLRRDVGGRVETLLEIVKNTPKYGAVKVNVCSATDLLSREFPELKWAVPGILPEGVNILAGRPKLGKSWLALHIAVAISLAGRALGAIKVERGSVLYLALEDGQRRLQERLRVVLKGGVIPDGLDLATEWPRMDAGGLEAIEDWLKDYPDARLIVIDTLKRVRPKDRAHARLYDGDYEAIAPLGDLAREFSVSILVVHHTRKADSDDPLDLVSGSLGLSGAADGILVLKRARGQADATLHATGRDFEDKEIALQWDTQINGWRMIGDAAEYRRSKERQEVINLLSGQDTPLPPKAVAEALGREYSATKKLLWTMARDGELHADAKGKYSLNNGNSGNSETERSGNGYSVTEVTNDSENGETEEYAALLDYYAGTEPEAKNTLEYAPGKYF